MGGSTAVIDRHDVTVEECRHGVNTYFLTRCPCTPFGIVPWRGPHRLQRHEAEADASCHAGGLPGPSVTVPRLVEDPARDFWRFEAWRFEGFDYEVCRLDVSKGHIQTFYRAACTFCGHRGPWEVNPHDSFVQAYHQNCPESFPFDTVKRVRYLGEERRLREADRSVLNSRFDGEVTIRRRFDGRDARWM